MSRMSSNTLPSRRTAGFTLIEVLVVVVILGILVTMAVALMSTAADDSRKTTFATSGRIFTDAATRYWIDNRVYLEDAVSGVLPAGFDPYVQESRWGLTPIGGMWDTELDSFGVTAALGVHFDGTGQTRDDAYMMAVDSIMDDGDLTTGEFRKLDSDRYYFVLAD